MTYVRYVTDNVVQAVVDGVFVILLAILYTILRYKKSSFRYIVRIVIFLALFTSLSVVAMVHDSDGRILWFVVTVFLMFFLLDRQEGLVWLGVVLILLMVLQFVNPQVLGLSSTDFVIFIVNQTMLAVALSWYEQIKIDSETQYRKNEQELEEKISEKTEDLARVNAELRSLNQNLELRVNEAIEKVRIQDRQMFQQSRLAQMGEMISMIAHQWRQPLASVASIIGSLHNKIRLQKIEPILFNQKLNEIAEITQHLSTTIDDFRDFFKSNKQIQKIGVHEVIENSLSIIMPSLVSKGILLKKEYEDAIVIHTYANEIKQVLLNLIKNAEDALTMNSIKEPWILIRVDEMDTHIVITVEDNAGGIPEAISEKVFDPYFSTKDDKNGTGLGLYMSKTIIDEHCEGELRVRNSTNGATFTMTLPRIIKGVDNAPQV
jgi:C4-dicarboxylate-specific signal transduction histidine kinase